jgi:hypothetical protein
MKESLKPKTNPNPPNGKQDYLKLWFDCLLDLNADIFWRYVRLFGIMQQNHQDDKYLAIGRLKKAKFTQGFARQELIYLGKIKK